MIDQETLRSQLLSLFFMTIAISLTATLVAVVAYDAGFADGVTETISTIPVNATISKTEVQAEDSTDLEVSDVTTLETDNYPASFAVLGGVEESVVD